MNRTLKKLAIVAGSALPAAAMFIGSASAGVSANSLVKNGTFDTNTAHWAGTNGLLPTAKLGVKESLLGVANVENTASPSQAYAYQCIPVSPETKYELSGKVHIPTATKRTGTVRLGLVFFEGAHCNGVLAGGGQTVPTGEQNVWKKLTVTPTSGDNAHSAMVRLVVAKNGTNLKANTAISFSAFFDDVQVVPKLKKLPGGPVVVGNPTPPPADPDDGPQEEPTPAPQPEEPQDQPAPQDDPAPQDEPQDQDEPVEEPQDQDEDAPTEEDVPGPAVPETDDEPAADEQDDPADEAPETPAAGTDDDAPANSGDEPVAADEQKVETLGEAEAGSTPTKPAKGGPKPGTNPTPGAPETGNAAIEDNGLIGSTELAGIAIGGLALMGLAFAAASRRGRKTEDDEDYSTES